MNLATSRSVQIWTYQSSDLGKFVIKGNKVDWMIDCYSTSLLGHPRYLKFARNVFTDIYQQDNWINHEFTDREQAWMLNATEPGIPSTGSGSHFT